MSSSDLGGEPSATLRAFVDAFNAHDPVAMARCVRPDGDAGFVFPSDDLPSWRAALGETRIEGDEATVGVALTVFGESAGAPPPETFWEVVRLRRADGEWRIVPVDPRYLERHPSDCSDWIASLAALVTDPNVMVEAQQAAQNAVDRAEGGGRRPSGPCGRARLVGMEREAFAALTEDEQIRRIETLGRAALRELGIVPLAVEPLVHAENTTFRVTSEEGTFCLRVARPGYQSEANLRSEIAFLDALARREFEAPRPFGGRVVKAQVPEVPEPRHCVLFAWQEGEFAKPRFTPDQAHRVGETMARLHAFSLAWAPPPGFERQNLHAWAGRERLAVESPSPAISEEDGRLLREVARESRAALAAMPREPFAHGLIHGDLHRGNVLFVGDAVRLIDFDDLGWGYLVADLAAALAYELRFDAFAEVAEAMLEGYETVRPLPPGTREVLPAFLRMRLMFVAEWVLGRTDHPRLRDDAPVWTKNLCEAIRRTDGYRDGS